MKILLTFLITYLCTDRINGHGLVIDPPGRNTIWREGFKNPANFDDMGVNCGGITVQYKNNGGKCGVCGDPHHGPLKHESGFPGGYANGIIGRVYKQGDTIQVKAKITANHLGVISYKLCPVNDNSVKLTQDCFDRYPMADVNGKLKFTISEYIGNEPGTITTLMKLPAGLTCSQCVIQWTYTSGNNVGDEKTPQEMFVNCADVAITVNGGPHPKPNVTSGELKQQSSEATTIANEIPYMETTKSTTQRSIMSSAITPGPSNRAEWVNTTPRAVTPNNQSPDERQDCNHIRTYSSPDTLDRAYNSCIQQCTEARPLHRECFFKLCACYLPTAQSASHGERFNPSLQVVDDELKKLRLRMERLLPKWFQIQ